jgi:23S rRNA (adenine2503-C2)-methyltransferase
VNDPRLPAWDRTPTDLRELGYERDPKHLFGRLQRLATWDGSGPVLARPGRTLVDRALRLDLPEIVDERPSSDGSTRLVLALEDGARIEAVHMPRAVVRPRVTVCLSSQVGCAMGCTFCATAKMGLVRNLAAHEIVGQLFAVLRRYGPVSAHTLNLVFMGMGEPLHNVDALLRALEVLCDPAGFGVPPARVTVSTAGHLPGLEQLAASTYIPELAVSVNASTDRVRRSLMPVGKKWPLADLRAALERWPRRPHSKLTLEYVLLADVNDDDESAERLADFAIGLRHIVNVIPFNEWGDGPSPYREPTNERVEDFVAKLRARGCLVTIRRSRGRDVRAACGTLVSATARASVSRS